MKMPLAQGGGETVMYSEGMDSDKPQGAPVHEQGGQQEALINAPRPVMRQRSQRPFDQNTLHLLTIGLLDTYKRINENYYEAKRRKQEQLQQHQTQSTSAQTAPTSGTGNTLGGESCDDKDSDYIIIPNEILNGRYRVDRRIGKGSFGQVVLASDTMHDRDVAIKIIKSKKPFTKQANTEIAILKKLNELDPTDKGCVVRLFDTFMHKGHRCLVFEKLAMNLYDLLRSTKFIGLSFDLIRKFARNILVALKFFAQPNVNIIHCDLKPENILLVEPKRSMLKVIDFGSSCTTTDKPFVYIQSRFYRSPEVMLGCSYGTPIDMWSLGCILIEMHSGVPLYPGQNEMEQMHLLVESRGLPPDEMLKEGKKTSNFFDLVENKDGTKTYRLKDLPPLQPSQRRQIPLTVEQALGIAANSPDAAPFKKSSKLKKESLERYLEFADLLNKMLTFSPDKRITPSEALSHPFLAVLPGNSSQGSQPVKADTQSQPPPPPPPSAHAKQQPDVGGGTKRPLSE